MIDAPTIILTSGERINVLLSFDLTLAELATGEPRVFTTDSFGRMRRILVNPLSVAAVIDNDTISTA